MTDDQEAKEGNSSQPISIITNSQAMITSESKNLWWWIRVALYSLFVLSGQAVATLLGNLYYKEGGHSMWLASLVQLGGFPILLLLYFIPTPKQPSDPNNPYIQIDAQAQSQSQSPSLKSLALVYLFLGAVGALNGFLYSVGLLHLPVSTYSLICSSQLAFNALFSFFLNAQKFTPYIINSLVLLTLSSILLAFQSDSEDHNRVSAGKYALVASVIIVVGLFGSGEWENLGREMDGYKLGKVSYVMNLVGTAISCRALGGQDGWDGVKVMAMILAIRGFVSYAYQYYLDDNKLKAQRTSVGGDELGVRWALNARIASVNGYL
ncbi:probable purine permease 10 [Eucalyptus grandis]|uniref:probable purine permease 10 n=1 Tax=Eucalyptus grandis TaxID=71139 RepID=UPI00192EB20A|nr:probable purine permease 10 [Eucalyptus grandis]